MFHGNIKIIKYDLNYNDIYQFFMKNNFNKIIFYLKILKQKIFEYCVDIVSNEVQYFKAIFKCS